MVEPQRAPESELDDWLRIVDRIPFVGSVKRELTGLRRLLYDRRAPRLAVIGAAGSGRTTLADGLLGALVFAAGAQDAGGAPRPAPGRWVRIDAGGRRLDWLELPSDADEAALLARASEAFEEALPDVILGVVAAGAEASEGARLQSTLRVLRGRLATAETLIVLTKADALDPLDEPARALASALDALRRATSELGLADERYAAVAARPTEGRPRDDLSALAGAILERLPDEARLEAVRALDVGRDARRAIARRVVNSCAAIAVTVGLAPIPFADAFILLPLQAAMVTGVAYVGGRGWDRRAALEWLASVGAVGSAGVGLRWGAQQLVKLIPGAGSLVGASVAGAGTLAIGRSAIAYYVDGPGRLGERPELRADNPA
ncbi:MAG: hypothetical protein KF729_23280 [Sandaracinaceae bacterium]|nr:hypothetical protein [Sandaracinaceae bacterium]